MPLYEYKALNSKGKMVSGSIDADSSKSARAKLRNSGIYISEIREDTRSAAIKSERTSLSLFSRISSQDISLFTRQLSTLIGAGLPLVGALGTLSEQADNLLLKKVLKNVQDNVNEGKSLADALSEYPRYFSNIYINMIRAGETSGALAIVLLRLAEFLEKSVQQKKKIWATLLYPIVITVIGAGVLFFLMAYVVPTVTQMFTETKSALPLSTVILISVSDIIQRWWWLMLLSVVFLFFAVKKYSKTKRGGYMVDKILLRLPLFGDLVKKTALSRFSRTLGVLLKSDIPIIKSMDIVSAVVDNDVISEAINNAKDNIREGEDIASQLKMSGLFPPIVIHMIAVGEKSGNLEDMLLKIAETYEGELETSVQALTSMLEPLMIVVMGATVGFIVMAILMPIFEMNQLIK